MASKRCLKGTRKNKNGNCVSVSQRSPISRKKNSSEIEWNDEIDKEWQDILKDLRTGKMKKMGYNGDGFQCPQPNCKTCLKTLSLEDIKAEVESRSRPVNILVPRKKNPAK